MTETTNAVILDTDVFSRIFVSQRPRAGHDVQRWRKVLKGSRPVIAFQTRAEVLAGARIGGWGEKRVASLRELVDNTPTVPPDNTVIDAYASLTAECRAAGHPLHSKQHTGDRWIAACAVAHNSPVLSGDNIFEDVPGLRRLES